MIEKYESRQIRVLIRHVLLEVWDPIGIKDEPNAQNEYDGYIGPVYDLLVNGGSDSKLNEFLYWAVHDHIGLDAATEADMVPTVAALRQIELPSQSN